MRIYDTNINKKLEFGEDYYIEYDLTKKTEIYKNEINFGNNKKKLIEKIKEVEKAGYKYFYAVYDNWLKKNLT